MSMIQTKRKRDEGEIVDPDFVVGEKVYYEMNIVVVTRVWRNKATMDADCQSSFRDQQAISVDYTMWCDDETGDAKKNVEYWDTHAWYEIMWFDLDCFRVILPQSYLSSNRGLGMPRSMVTEENAKPSWPAPSEWNSIRKYGV